MSSFKNNLSLIFLLFAITTFASSQEISLGRRMYSENAPSVFLLYIQSQSGEFVAQGSGFLVQGGRIVTNAHVANAGKVFLELGPARLPARIRSIDSTNDLAVLSVDVELSVKPLTLSNSTPQPGDAIFAIGNPEGLEKSISQGMLSAVRDIDSRRLFQITTPISHGSSGGPVFNSSGEVVGVAVGTLASGQNLNFAVPVEYVKTLMNRGDSPKTPVNLLEEVQSLQQRQKEETYSADANSSWQQDQTQIDSLLARAVESAGANSDILLRIARVAQNNDLDIAANAAHRAVEATPSTDAYLLIADILSSKYQFAGDADRISLMKQCETNARMAIKLSRSPTAEMQYRLADVLEDEHFNVESEGLFRSVEARTPTDSELHWQSVRALMRFACSLNKAPEEHQWFDALLKSSKANSYDWNLHAMFLKNSEQFKAAGDAYTQAASSIDRDWCEAGWMYEYSGQQDAALYSGRQCISLLTGKAKSESDLARAHESVSTVLNQRGVYAEALTHAKEAITLDPSYPWAFATEADALFYLRRYQEAATASKEAIRLSDGKFSLMHFRLASIYFEMENWDLARQSFEKAAELDPTSESAAYNVALCYQRLEYYVDAAHWYEEVLRRNPNRSDKVEIQQRISSLRR